MLERKDLLGLIDVSKEEITEIAKKIVSYVVIFRGHIKSFSYCKLKRFIIFIFINKSLNIMIF